MIKGTSQNIVCDRPGCNKILNDKPHLSRRSKKGRLLHYCPACDPELVNKIGIHFLKPNHAGALSLSTTGETINYGAIRIEGDEFIFYTHKAMMELFGHSDPLPKHERKAILAHGEAWLENNGYISKIKITDIQRVLY